jgi:DNA polymerase II small subunit
LAATNTRLQQLIDFVSDKNAIINQDAAALLLDEESPEKLIQELLEENQFILDRELVSNKILQKKTKIDLKQEAEVKGGKCKPLAAELNARFRIMDELNITGKSCSEGKIEDFLDLFRDRFQFLSSLLKRRSGLNPKTTSRLNKIERNRKLDVIGMVSEKWVSKNGHLCLKLEDEEGDCLAIILKDDFKLNREAEKIILDDVICVHGVKGQGEMVIVKELFYPDISLNRSSPTVTRDVSICVTSDMHIGSKLFLEKEFKRFIDWLNCRVGDDEEKERAGKIKYLFLVGDNVDGIGVYPEQLEELNIPDIYRQYEVLTELLADIPDYIEVFVCPGQHDAVRRADPQPAIPKEFVPKLYERKNFHFLSSPGWVEIEGLKVLMYHGASLHDLYSSVGYLDPKEPQRAISDVLRRRSLMVSYGLKQPYVPEKKDYTLIRVTPDIYLGGDMHHNGYGVYRNTTIINSGTWQKQTDFQVKLGHVPTPGMVPVLNLKTHKITENYFYKQEES